MIHHGKRSGEKSPSAALRGEMARGSFSDTCMCAYTPACVHTVLNELYVSFQYERKQEKQQNQELTEKLDQEYKELVDSLSKGGVRYFSCSPSVY